MFILKECGYSPADLAGSDDLTDLIWSDESRRGVLVSKLVELSIGKNTVPLRIQDYIKG